MSPQGDDLFLARRKRGPIRARRERKQIAALAESEMDQRRHVEDLVRRVITHRRLEAVLQPIVDMRGGGVVGAEALARFSEGPTRPPDVWFAEASSVGLGTELELIALEIALGQLRRLPSGIYLSVNASVDTVVTAHFGELMQSVAGERVVLELTEHDRVGDYTQLGRVTDRLRAMGIRLAVDDAGAGYSSFRHILHLRPDVIKLDVGLTRGIDADPARQALGSALLTFGLEALHASMVAEGIETAAEFDTLQALGVPFGQGYYLGRPEQPVGPGANGARPRLWVPSSGLRVAHAGESERLDDREAPHPQEDYAALLELAAEIREVLGPGNQARQVATGN